MKSKGLTYGLLVVVGIIWYQVFVRVKSNFTEETIQPSYNNSSISMKTIRKPKDFDLKADFQDPFRTGSIEKRVIKDEMKFQTNEMTSSTKKQKPVKYTLQWPEIQYFGFVRNTNSKNPRILVSIDNQIFKLIRGDEVLDNIRISSVTRDELRIRYQGETKTFVKK